MYLVIGYGNSLRGDDAVGRLLVEEVEAWELPGVRTLSVHQLTPELALDMAEAERVIFLDAALPGPGTTVEEATVHGEPELCLLNLAVDPTLMPPVPTSMTHHVDPRSLMALAAALYGATPAAYLLALPAVKFEVRIGQEGIEGLSETARAGMMRAQAILRSFLAHSD
jgi:hydrogenase maturation protease